MCLYRNFLSDMITFIIISFVDKLCVAGSSSFEVKYNLQEVRLQKPVSGRAKCQDLWYASGWTRVHTAVRRPLALYREKLQTFLEIKR